MSRLWFLSPVCRSYLPTPTATSGSTGRKKDIIIRKGENISAREIEDLLAAHPAVEEVAVVGVPDAAAGEIACAVLRLRTGAGTPTLDDVTRHLLARGLSKRKLPERVAVVDDSPARPVARS
jgi:non-ribosomal peptide synthetase component E (peptide arylation enzyme)